jgi:aminoglycoside/choline kinase family phosphotransferase
MRSRQVGAFRRGFDLGCVQRGLKAAGRFAYIKRVKNNPKFLQYIPGIIRRAREIISEYQEFKVVGQVLDQNIPDIYL